MFGNLYDDGTIKMYTLGGLAVIFVCNVITLCNLGCFPKGSTQSYMVLFFLIYIFVFIAFYSRMKLEECSIWVKVIALLYVFFSIYLFYNT